MKFIAAIILAAAIAGVSANVHSTCKCVSNGDINKRVTAKACRRVRSPRLLSYLDQQTSDLKSRKSVPKGQILQQGRVGCC